MIGYLMVSWHAHILTVRSARVNSPEVLYNQAKVALHSFPISI